jgi:hypothetical protein
VTIGVEVAGRDNEFGWRTAVWTLLVHVGKRKIIRYAVLPAPAPNAIDAEYVATINKQAKCGRFIHTDRTDQGITRVDWRLGGGNVFEPTMFSPLAIPSCEIPARLALVVWGQFLVFAVLEFAVLPGKTTP